MCGKLLDFKHVVHDVQSVLLKLIKIILHFQRITHCDVFSFIPQSCSRKLVAVIVCILLGVLVAIIVVVLILLAVFTDVFKKK